MKIPANYMWTIHARTSVYVLLRVISTMYGRPDNSQHDVWAYVERMDKG